MNPKPRAASHPRFSARIHAAGRCAAMRRGGPRCGVAARRTAVRGPAAHRRCAVRHGLLPALAGILAPGLVLAQESPFLTGANALQSNILAWLTPIAIILIMVLGAMAMANRMSWGWALTAIVGIAMAFGAPQIVTWVRGLFGV